jgi:hypothetical protein
MDLRAFLLMCPRRAVPLVIPAIHLRPSQLPFYKSGSPRNRLESTLLQVFILESLKVHGINTYEKQGRGYRLWLTDCSKVVSSSILRIHFQVPYLATPLLATLTKTAGVCRDSSHFGTEPFSLATRHCPVHSGNALASIPGTSFSAFL